MNDSLKIRAAAFAVRAGHTDEMAETFVEELRQKGQLGMPHMYGPVLAALMERASSGRSAREKLIRTLERHASSAAAAAVAEGILSDHRRELAAAIKAEFYAPGDGCSGLVREIAAWIEADE